MSIAIYGIEVSEAGVEIGQDTQHVESNKCLVFRQHICLLSEEAL